MTKDQFLNALCDKLSHLPQEEVEERLQFYIEAIEDRMEEGFSEEDAVAAVGSVEEIAAQIAAEIPAPPPVAEEPTVSKRRPKTWEIVLLILGSPIWFSLLIAAFAVAISLYAALWSVIVALWSVFSAVAACALGLTLSGILFAVFGNTPSGIAMVGAGFVCAGLAILFFLGCRALTTGICFLTKKAFRRKETA